MRPFLVVALLISALRPAAAALPGEFASPAASGDVARLLGQIRASRRTAEQARLLRTTHETGAGDRRLTAQLAPMETAEAVRASVVSVNAVPGSLCGDSYLCNGVFVPGPDGRAVIAVHSAGFPPSSAGRTVRVSLDRGEGEEPREVNGLVLAAGDPLAGKPIALIALAERGLDRPARPLRFDPRLGEPALSLGRISGFGLIASVGSVARADSSGERHFDRLRTDFSVGRSDHGMPVFDMNGGVIGLRDAEGFAIPASHVAAAVAQYDRRGDLRAGTLGARVERGTGAERLVVAAVLPGTPLDDAGVQVGDGILSVDGADLSIGTTREALVRLLLVARYKSPGERVELVLRRDGVSRRVTATVSAAPPTGPDVL